WAIRFYQHHQWRQPTHMQEAARQIMDRLFEPHALGCVTPALPDEAKAPPTVNAGQTVKLVPHSFALEHFVPSYIHAHVNPAWSIEDAQGRKEIRNTRECRVLFSGWLMWRVRIRAYLTATLTTPAST